MNSSDSGDFDGVEPPMAASDDWPAGSSDRAMHHRHALIYYLRGGCLVGPDGADRFGPEAGDLVVLHPPVRHVWTTVGHARGEREGVATTFCLFTAPHAWMQWLEGVRTIQHYTWLRFTRPETSGRVLEGLNTIKALAGETGGPARRLRWLTLEQMLLWCRLDQSDAGQPIDPRIARAQRHMAEHHDRRLTLSDMAQAAGLSRAQFAALFHEQIGQPPKKYLEHLRIEKVKTLLAESHLKIEAIAMMTGFCDGNYLCNRFRRATGLSPARWRQRLHAGQ